jgi:hypothetical protein
VSLLQSLHSRPQERRGTKNRDPCTHAGRHGCAQSFFDRPSDPSVLHRMPIDAASNRIASPFQQPFSWTHLPGLPMPVSLRTQSARTRVAKWAVMSAAKWRPTGKKADDYWLRKRRRRRDGVAKRVPMPIPGCIGTQTTCSGPSSEIAICRFRSFHQEQRNPCCQRNCHFGRLDTKSMRNFGSKHYKFAKVGFHNIAA